MNQLDHVRAIMVDQLERAQSPQEEEMMDTLISFYDNGWITAHLDPTGNIGYQITQKGIERFNQEENRIIPGFFS
jgi:hypothetical protein